MTTNDNPLYVSQRSWRSLWQEYRIYANRIELPSCIVGKKVVPVDEIVEVEVRPPFVAGDVFRGKGFAYGWALKLDMADLSRHVAIRRKSEVMKRIRFTSDNQEKFVEICKSIMKKSDNNF